VFLLQPWYHPTCKREQAEEMLSHIRTEGAFLVRVGERVSGSFAISFRAEDKGRRRTDVVALARNAILKGI
jgi:hypothetical protein